MRSVSNIYAYVGYHVSNPDTSYTAVQIQLYMYSGVVQRSANGFVDKRNRDDTVEGAAAGWRAILLQLYVVS